MSERSLEPLTDDEAQEMVYLFRVVRAGNDRPGEAERCRELLKRFEATNERKRQPTPNSQEPR